MTTHLNPLRPAARALLFAAVLLSWSPAALPAAKSEPDPQARIDSTARLLAGLAPTHPVHLEIAQQEAWKEHSVRLRAAWTRMKTRQLAPMAAWRDVELPRTCPVGKTLLYPFSGPDFINAYWLFPGCEVFILFGLEPVGEIPPVESLGPPRLAKLLEDVRGANTDLFARNYFVTGKMTKQLQTEELRGVVPLLIVSLALAGARVQKVEPFDLAAPAPAAAPVPQKVPASGRGPVKGVRIDFLAPDSPTPRRLIYFRINVSDNALAVRPEFLDYLRGLEPATTLLKSASYLLHGEEFRKLRNVLLEVSAFLVQDDSGLPYGMLLRRGWDVRLYGRYEVPIPPFESAYQPLLARAYESRRPQSLPFFFGYHRNRGDDRSNVMVGRPASAQALGVREGPGK